MNAIAIAAALTDGRGPYDADAPINVIANCRKGISCEPRNNPKPQKAPVLAQTALPPSKPIQQCGFEMLDGYKEGGIEGGVTGGATGALTGAILGGPGGALGGRMIGLAIGGTVGSAWGAIKAVLKCTGNWKT